MNQRIFTLLKWLGRLSFKDNPFRCSYILPDGITYKKGFVKDMDEALRYRSLPLDEEAERIEHGMDPNKSEDRKKPELSQNVTSLPICSRLPYVLIVLLMKFNPVGICLDE